MSPTEQHIVLTAKLYECRKALRFLSGEKYADRIESWKLALLSSQPVDKSIMSHAIDAASRSKDDVITMWLLAAAVELIEEGKTP